MTFAYPADSGQDYAIIEEAGGMRSRVVDDGAGNWTLVDNVNYRGRPPGGSTIYATACEPRWPSASHRRPLRARHDRVLARRRDDNARPARPPLFLRRDDDEKLDHAGVSGLGRILD